MIFLNYIDAPVGKMRVGASDKGICLFDFDRKSSTHNTLRHIEGLSGDSLKEGDHPLFNVLKLQIDEYFDGTRKDFDLPLHLIGTDFQVSVWNALLQVPYGETRSYKQQSIVLGNQKAIRAVATANGENSIAIVVPCHRIIGTDGSLTGYAGGLENKKILLDLERKYSGKATQAGLF